MRQEIRTGTFLYGYVPISPEQYYHQFYSLHAFKWNEQIDALKMDKHLKDIIGKCDDEAAPVLDKVIKDIFMSCDTENEGLVPVNKLIDFIMPFLQGNTHALDELQKALDPNSGNPSIDIDTFYKDMNEWTLKISSADHIEDEDIHNVTPRDLEGLMDKEVTFPHSTPRSSFGHHLLKGYVESGISNLSITSSANESHSMYFPERTVLEEQIQQLQHQNRQVTEELARVKVELTATAEHNEILQAELDKVVKKLANGQKLNAQLQSDRNVDDNCEEELCCTRKQVVKLERSLANLEKQNAQLQQELDAVLVEKQGLECQIQRLDRKSEETKSNMVILQTEIDIRKSEVVSEHKTNEALSQRNQELCDLVEKCIINIERLKLEKAMLRKFCRDKMNKGESLENLNLNRSLRSNSFSEYAEISRKIADKRRISDVTARFVPGTINIKPKPFNSPKLLRMLREPVTPTLDKPLRMNQTTNLTTMILNRASPHLKEQQRVLLDSSLPGDLNRIPVLTPEHLGKAGAAGEPNSVAVEMLEVILERVVMEGGRRSDGNLFNTPNSTDSPPVMYVVERTPDLGCEAGHPQTPYSPKMNDSSDEFFFYEMMSSSTERQNENLLDEMAKATVCGIDEESECEESTTDSGDKEKRYISEVHLKLNDYVDLEQKCEALEQRIEDLEAENSLKDTKISDLNNEIGKLRQKLTGDEDGRTVLVEEFRKRIDDLEEEKEIYQSEKRSLAEQIKRLNEDKDTLQLSKEELLLKIVIGYGTNEPIRSRGEESPNGQDIECIRIDYDRLKSRMETYQILNKNLSAKNGLLQKSMKEKEKLLEEYLEEIVRLREDSAKFMEDIRLLRNNLEEYKRVTSNLEEDLIRKGTDLEESHRERKILDDVNSCLRLKERQLLSDLEDKTRCLEEVLATKEGNKSDLKLALEETRRKLEQEVKKQDYLCKKFVDLENELISEKNSSAIFKETCEDLQNDELSRDNLDLYKSHEDRTKEIQSLIEAKSFIAKRNEELLQENAEIVRRYDIVAKELGNKMSLLEDMNRKLKEIDQLRAENRRIKIESEEIVQKMRSLDGESDQVDSSSSRKGGSRERKVGRRANFDRLAAWNAKLEERNAALSEEVAELRERLTKEMEAKDSIVARMNTTKDILCERRIRLGRATDSAVDIWKPHLEKYIARNLFGDDTELEDETLLFVGPLDEEMWQLKHQIHSTTMLLSHLTSFMNRQMLKKNVCTQTEPELSSNFYRIGEISTTRMEETFATLVLTYTVDKDLLHQRFHAKKIQLGETERSLGEAVSALTLYLERNAIGLDVSNFMSNILQLCTQVSVAAVQYGSLRQQTELTAAAEMMVNYVANLRQEIELLTQQLPVVGTTTALDRIEFQSDEKPNEINVSQGKSRRFLSCVKTTCIMFTLSMFVLVASLVLNTDVVFKIHRCPPPT
ncbi:hypothetical protein QE152_g32109 [Popillia japonica]|uniref:Uncharacterized protein n=1 Tax=Popillia japonica TaxID=7064 RepID=A0AAW1J058_POPJA